MADQTPSEEPAGPVVIEAEAVAPETAPAPVPDEPAQGPASRDGAPGPRRPARSGGVGVALGLVVGGAAAATLGFGLARYAVPEGWPFPYSGAEAIASQVAGLASRLDAETAERTKTIDTLETGMTEFAAKGDVAELQDAFARQEIELAALGDRMEALEARATDLEKRPLTADTTGATAAAVAAFGRDVTDLRAEVDAKLAELAASDAAARAAGAEAEAAARRASLRAALGELSAAAESGAALGPQLDKIAALAPDLPLTTIGAWRDGVPTLASLQADFAAAARAALAAGRSTAPEGSLTERLTAFAKAQLGFRSLTPQAGGSDDAVLSRAEAALKTGDLATALAEIEQLSEAARPAMADWAATAQSRLAALASIAALATE